MIAGHPPHHTHMEDRMHHYITLHTTFTAVAHHVTLNRHETFMVIEDGVFLMFSFVVPAGGVCRYCQ